VIWTIWRQHRAEAGVGALILAALAAAMLVVGTTARDRARALGLPTCANAHGDCSPALGALHRDFHTIPPFTAALIAVPLLAGMFWAAPLVSREYEAGTHRLAWTQSVSPLRWITTKISVIFTVLGAAALALGLLATWTLDPLTAAFGGRYNSTWYDTQGIVPVACMIFALAVGVAASALIRRTIPAMAVTLLIYAVARIPIHWIRGHFWPAVTGSYTTPFSTLLQNPTRPIGDDFTSHLSPNDWVQTVTIIDPAGHTAVVDGSNLDVLSKYCPDLTPSTAPGNGTRDGGTASGIPHAGPINVPAPTPPTDAQIASCRPKIANLSLHEKITYQPASHFWLIQTVESLIFISLAALLVTAAILAVTRHRPT
jgi:hypothetical protein